MSDYIGPPRVKTAALGAIAGAITAHKERNKLREMGLSEEQIDNALTRTGAFARGLGRDAVGSGAGAGLGFLHSLLSSTASGDPVSDRQMYKIFSSTTGLGLGGSAIASTLAEKERAQLAANTAELEKLRNQLSST